MRTTWTTALRCVRQHLGHLPLVIENMIVDFYHPIPILNIVCSYGAFACQLADQSVVTFGVAYHGSDSSAVQDHLKNVNDVVSTQSAFAALLHCGRVVTWGNPTLGGDSTLVAPHLKNQVIRIFSNQAAFAAITQSFEVITWGDPRAGGNHTPFRLDNIQTIVSTSLAFAALTTEGRVMTWGGHFSGGDSSRVAAQLTGIKQIFSNQWAFAAVNRYGGVVPWGYSEWGGKASGVEQYLRHGVQKMVSNDWGFAALKEDSTAVIWGHHTEVLSDTVDIYSTNDTFAVLGRNRTLVMIGNFSETHLMNIKEIYSNGGMLAAYLDDGSIRMWNGYHFIDKGQGDYREPNKMYFNRLGACATILTDGSMDVFGATAVGGYLPNHTERDSPSQPPAVLRDSLTNVQDIFHTAGAFAAIVDHGMNVITWGGKLWGHTHNPLSDHVPPLKYISVI